MLEQQVAHSRKVLERDIHDSLEVSGFALDLEVGTEVSLVNHELVLRRGDNGSCVLALSDVGLGDL